MNKFNKYPKVDISDCFTKIDIIKKAGIPLTNYGKLLVNEYILHYNLDISHLKMLRKTYTDINKQCPVCNKEFKTKIDHPKEKTTCSTSCANSYFRSGKNHYAFKEDSDAGYRVICFEKHKKECIICGENKIVAVHHYNKNHNDNRVENLVPLCPTHHVYIHSGYAYLIQDKVDQYVKSFTQ